MDKQLIKARIAKNFGRAANQYDQFAHLQKKIGYLLLEQLKANSLRPEKIIDIGAGTGFFSKHLQAEFPSSQVISVDIAHGMSLEAKKNNPLSITADFDNLPFSDQSMDCVFANLALQWSLESAISFAELKRILKPGGILVFSSLGPNTLSQLKQTMACQCVQNLTAAATQVLLTELKFSKVMLKQQAEMMYFKAFSDVLQDLKNIGAQTVMDRKTGLLGKAKFKHLAQTYEQYREEQGLPASYEVIIGVAYA